MNYDPNMTNSGRCARQTVELTFQMREYSKTITTTVGGNCTGLSVIQSAVENVIEELGGEDGAIVLEKPNGDTLECDMWDTDLEEILVSARITEIVPDGDVE